MKLISCLLLVALLLAPVSALASSAYIFKVNAGGSYVRSSDGEKIGSLKKGMRVLYWGKKKGQMLEIMTPNGKVGYVYQGNLERYGAMSTKQLYITKSAAKLYKRVGTKMKRKGSVDKGVPLVVYRTAGEWAYVRNMAGKGAYIKTDELKKIA